VLYHVGSYNKGFMAKCAFQCQNKGSCFVILSEKCDSVSDDKISFLYIKYSLVLHRHDLYVSYMI
jgi:hypothetical protein